MPRPRPVFRTPALLLALTIAAGVLLAVAPRPLGVYLAAVNLATVLAYAYDKSAAVRQWRRVPERSLHLLAFAGGTPAAFASQLAFRHKTRKESFRLRFWIIAGVQVLVVAAVVCYRISSAR